MSKLRDDLRTASILIVIGVVLFFPIIFLYFTPNETLNNLGLVLNMAYAAIWVFSYAVLRNLFKHLKINDTEGLFNWIISVLISSTVVSTLIGLKMLPDGMAMLLNIVMVMAGGVLNILLGIKFLNAKSNFYEKGNAIGYLSIFTGVCYATLILIPFGMILQVITDILVATLFDKAAKEIK